MYFLLVAWERGIISWVKKIESSYVPQEGQEVLISLEGSPVRCRVKRLFVYCDKISEDGNSFPVVEVNLNEVVTSDYGLERQYESKLRFHSGSN